MAEEMHFEINKKPVSDATKKKVHEALQKALHDQLSEEARTMGHEPGRAAIHGMTGVSSRQAQER